MNTQDSVARSHWQLGDLTDAQLIGSLQGLLASCRRSIARLIAHLAEVEERRLHLRKACSSMFVYCTTRLGMSEDEACRRIDAARLASRFPSAYALLEDGSLSLTTLCLLKPYICADNHVELLAGVSRRSVADAREWLAARFPRPDVAATIRKVPQPAGATASQQITSAVSTSLPLIAVEQPMPADAGAAVSAATASPTANAAMGGAARAAASPPPSEAPAAARPAPAPARSKPTVTPLSADRFKVQLTVSRAVKDKIELARDLMSHGRPDLEVIVERALDLLIADIKKKRFGQTSRPAKQRPAKRDHVTNATKRTVVERDGLQCTFVDDDGNRCTARGYLQVEHRQPRAKGGGSEPEEVTFHCAAHNELAAEREFGRDHIERAIARRRNEDAEGRHPRQRG